MGAAQEEQLAIAQDILRDLGIPMWLVYSDEGSDPTFAKLVADVHTPAALLLTPTTKRVLISSLDADNVDVSDKVVTHGRHEVPGTLVAQIKELGFSGRMALNYSTMHDVKVDRLPAGHRDWIDGLVRKAFWWRHPLTALFPRRHLFSGEAILYGLYDRKTPTQLGYMRVATERAQTILHEAFRYIKSGMTDFDAMNLVQRITTETRDRFIAQTPGVVAETYAWPEKYCPIVLTGDTFTKGGHAMTCGATIEPGNTVYFDFGVKLTFEDQTSWSSDLQRVGYLLRQGEDRASDRAQCLFDILYASVQAGIDALWPGVHGWEVDKAVRSVINDAGYDYDHATGHPIGEDAHNPGTGITYLKNPPGPENLTIQPNGVYTIEPRIPVRNGVSIEEDVWVNPDGRSEPLCTPQTELYLCGP